MEHLEAALLVIVLLLSKCLQLKGQQRRSRVLYDLAVLALILYMKYKKRRWWVRAIFRRRQSLGEYNCLIAEMKLHDKETFFGYFRMTPERFDDLLSRVGPHLRRQTTRFRKAISPGEQLALTLRYLAHGGSQRIISLNYRLGKSTTCGIIKRTTKISWDTLSPDFVKVPTKEEWVNIAHDFERLWQLPGCIGAIDGKHFYMQAPPNSGSLYYSYKGRHSVILLGVCDGKYCFTIVDIGAAGRQADRSMFSHSAFGRMLQDSQLNVPPPKCLPGTQAVVNHYFVGDEAFPLTPYLMRPYSGHNLDLRRACFNYRLSRARRIIENTFGILTAHWRIFRQDIVASVQVMETLVLSSICLHNYLRSMDSKILGSHGQYCPHGFADYEDANGVFHPGQWRQEVGSRGGFQSIDAFQTHMYPRNATSMRDTLADYVCSQQGEVSWQYDIVNRGLQPHEISQTPQYMSQ